MHPSGLSDDEILDLVAFANRLADAAGEVTSRYFRAHPGVDNKLGDGGFDPVTIADRDAEAAIRSLIKEHHPEHGILGEEHGFEEGTSPLTWVIDPIDGTRAFIIGSPVWGTLIGLNDGTRPFLGVMDQAFSGERFVGFPGRSELRHRGEVTELRTRSCARIEDAIVSTTSPAPYKPGAELDAFHALEACCRTMRYGGDCYYFCLLAMGLIDLVVEAGLEPYDIQALVPIVENAGGVVTTWSGGPAGNGGQIVAAGDPSLHRQALEMLRGAAAG